MADPVEIFASIGRSVDSIVSMIKTHRMRFNHLEHAPVKGVELFFIKFERLERELSDLRNQLKDYIHNKYVMLDEKWIEEYENKKENK